MKAFVFPVSAFVTIAAALVFAQPSDADAKQAAPPAFSQCKACHTVEKGGRNGVGPNLNGVLSRASGSAAGFNYSPAMKKAALRWDDKTLNEFLAAPRKKVPGTRMPIGVADPAKRASIIAYLKSATAK